MKKTRHISLPMLLLLLALIMTAGTVITLTQTEDTCAASQTGWRRINGKKYYYKNGKAVTGWKKAGKRYYYLDSAKGGAVVTGWKSIGGKKYCFTSSGARYTRGWHKIGGKYYYMTSGCYVTTGWKTLNNKRYYFIKSGRNKGAAAVGTHTMGNRIRTFNSRGVLIKTQNLVTVQENQLQKPTGTATIRNYLLNAFRAMGTKYYLGGWEMTATTDVPATMDCSGYVGWASYQIMKGPNAYTGAAAKSYSIPSTYKSWGWGKTISHKTLAKNKYKGSFKAGDVVKVKHDGGSSGHVWIVVGQCSDGSYVLIHCSGNNTNGCVQLAGTPTPEGLVGEAYGLAKTYMEKYHASTLKQYSFIKTAGPYGTLCTDLYNYMTSSQVSSFRWSSSVMSDPDGLQSKSAAAVLKNLYGES